MFVLIECIFVLLLAFLWKVSLLSLQFLDRDTAALLRYRLSCFLLSSNMSGMSGLVRGDVKKINRKQDIVPLSVTPPPS